MPVDEEKLRELVCTLSSDQKRLIREGLADGQNLDPESLRAAVDSLGEQDFFERLAADSPDGGAPDGGAPDGGTAPPPTTTEPALSRW